jgi:hypothetical protein
MPSVIAKIAEEQELAKAERIGPVAALRAARSAGGADYETTRTQSVS